jgi:EmrB/QacA subfamily drug resistance transporter
MLNVFSLAPPTPYAWRWAALATLLIAEAMNLLDSTVVQVAAPVIHADLGGPESDIQWFSAAYTLPFALLLLTGGRLGDIAGRKRIFRLGVSIFVLSSLCCALASSTLMLIAMRSVQGAAAALIIPQTFGLIRSMFEGDELAKALGSIGPVMGLAAVLGPVLGGVLTYADVLGSSWRAVFLVNIPLGMLVLLTAPLLQEDRAAIRPRLDVGGTALAIVGTTLVVYPLMHGNADGWSARTWAALVAGIAVFGVFGFHQRGRARRGQSAVIETSLFHSPRFPAALVSSVLFFAVMNGLMLVIVLQLQLGLQTDVLTAGLTLLPWSCGLAVSSWLAGAYLVPRYGSRIMFMGLVMLLVGILGAVAVYATAVSSAFPWPLLPALAVCGLGLGLFTVPFFNTALGRVRPAETGSAAGLLNAVQQLGSTLGVALLGSVFFHSFNTAIPGAATPGAVALSGAGNACWLAAGLVVATIIAAGLLEASPVAWRRRPGTPVLRCRERRGGSDSWA